MAARIIATTFVRTLPSFHIARHARVATQFTLPFTNQVSFLHVKAYDKELKPVEEAAPKEKLSSKETVKQHPEFINTDPNVFGNFQVDDTPPDPGDVIEDEFIQNPTRQWKKMKTKEYAALIKEHMNNNRLKEAIDVLEIRMIKEDRVKPDSYIYNLLISGCAKAGYTKKAFQLFNKMKQRDLKVKGGTYTSLFNACANAPSIADGLTKATHLREIMLEKGYEPNAVNYNAMIKAYGRCGDTKTAYILADEMLEKGLQVNGDTFNFLLQACASDKRYGFRHALLTWHRMHKNLIKPDYYSFNLMLRCIRDSSIGDVETMEGVIRYILDESKKISGGTSQEQLQITGKSDNTLSVDPPGEVEIKITESPRKYKGEESVQKERPNPFANNLQDVSRQDFKTENGQTRGHLSKSVQQENLNPFREKLVEVHNPEVKTEDDQNRNQLPEVVQTEDDQKLNQPLQQDSLNPFTSKLQEISRPEFETPNLLSKHPHLGSLMAIKEVTTPHDRLLLLGGFSGFLQEMKKYGITPGIETFTALLEVIPPTYAAEKQLITMVRKIGLKADIDFFNILIKKRSMRFEYEGAKEVLTMIQTAGLYPDIVTYGVLALGCRTQEEARELIAEMKAKNIRMNAQILGAMLRQGCAQKAFPYVTEILQISLDENIRPNEIFLRHLDNFYKQCANLIDIRHFSTKKKNFKKEHAKFCSKYRTWQEEQGIGGLKLEDAIKKVKQRPYQQFSEERIQGMEELKNAKLARKTKRRKYIKKIKVDKLRSDEDSKETPKQIESPTERVQPV